jgi:hypothetical protein
MQATPRADHRCFMFQKYLQIIIGLHLLHKFADKKMRNNVIVDGMLFWLPDYGK